MKTKLMLLYLKTRIEEKKAEIDLIYKDEDIDPYETAFLRGQLMAFQYALNDLSEKVYDDPYDLFTNDYDNLEELLVNLGERINEEEVLFYTIRKHLMIKAHIPINFILTSGKIAGYRLIKRYYESVSDDE